MRSPLVIWLYATITLLVQAADGREAAEPTPPAAVQRTNGCDVDMWFVSTRHLGCSCTTPVLDPTFEVLRYDESAGWTDSSLPELLAGDPSITTVVYVHGNRVELNEVWGRVWGVYRGLRTGGAQGPFRLVVWTWPADKIPGQLQDIRTKARRTLCEGYYLGTFLTQWDARHRISLIGYSYGARVVAAALHALSGGAINGQTLLTAPPGELAQIRVALMAAALDQCALLPTGRWSMAWQSIERLLIVYNPRDPVLRRFRFTERGWNPQALGFVGMPGMMGDGSRPVEQYNVSGYVGRTHNESEHFGSSGVMEIVAPFVMGHEIADGN